MEKLKYIEEFEKLGMGMFVHFGLYSIVGKGEWYKDIYGVDMQEYSQLIHKFKIKKNWAKDLVATAKKAGFKYITITTRHHEGFSLFDTCGLNEFDSLHSPTGRDLMREFVDECRKADIVPFFYHTLLDWWKEEYKTDFPAYLKYLRDSVEILCRNYGKIGGFWFDGWWDKKEANWEFDELYALIRKYQPEAMIINNTGLGRRGEVGHKEIDSVTFERGKPRFVDCSEKYVAGEMCQVLNDHWGYTKNDYRYKAMEEIIGDLIDCRRFNCNFLLNAGLMGDGSIRPIDKAMLCELGNWVRANKKAIYDMRSTDITAENAYMLTDGRYYYAVVPEVPMIANPNVAKSDERIKNVRIHTEKKIVKAKWLDNGKAIEIKDNTFMGEAFFYGNSMGFRIARFKLK